MVCFLYYIDQTTSEVTPTDTRVMIFSSFRDSVQEIAEMLNYHYPLVRVMTFVGHSTGKNTKGFTQKEQLEVMKWVEAEMQIVLRGITNVILSIFCKLSSQTDF